MVVFDVVADCVCGDYGFAAVAGVVDAVERHAVVVAADAGLVAVEPDVAVEPAESAVVYAAVTCSELLVDSVD